MANSVPARLVVMIQPKQTISKVVKSTRMCRRGGPPLRTRDLSGRGQSHKGCRYTCAFDEYF